MAEGLYKRTCVKVVRFIRKHDVPLSAQLSTFLNEPLDLAALRFLPSHRVLDNVLKKLQGTEFSEDGKELTPEDQVSELIRIAVDHKNYVRHFPGWCPFW
jgi:phosphatidylinositol kinase/protein kinase (PI-3  family)